jgi:hypothetical protein
MPEIGTGYRTKESFLENEAPKAYRKAFREETDSLIEERRDLEWLMPIRYFKKNASEIPIQSTSLLVPTVHLAHP